MEQNGTMVTVEQQCSNCHVKPFRLRSQPFILGRYPAGNILLSFATLMAGASISKVLLVFGILVWQPTHRGPSFTINANFFCQAFSNTGSHTKLIQSLKSVKDSVWSGDGRFDSMGHSEKWGVYAMFCCTIMKIVHF
jgi:hypothetical protein